MLITLRTKCEKQIFLNLNLKRDHKIFPLFLHLVRQ